MARILTVDDSPVMRQMVKATLIDAGHEVVQGANGEEALRIAATQVFDMVITDVNMPVMDGFETAKRIREVDRSLHIHTPIIAMTGSGTGDAAD